MIGNEWSGEVGGESTWTLHPSINQFVCVQLPLK